MRCTKWNRSEHCVTPFEAVHRSWNPLHLTLSPRAPFERFLWVDTLSRVPGIRAVWHMLSLRKSCTSSNTAGVAQKVARNWLSQTQRQIMQSWWLWTIEENLLTRKNQQQTSGKQEPNRKGTALLELRETGSEQNHTPQISPIVLNVRTLSSTHSSLANKARARSAISEVVTVAGDTSNETWRTLRWSGIWGNDHFLDKRVLSLSSPRVHQHELLTTPADSHTTVSRRRPCGTHYTAGRRRPVAGSRPALRPHHPDRRRHPRQSRALDGGGSAAEFRRVARPPCGSGLPTLLCTCCRTWWPGWSPLQQT